MLKKKQTILITGGSGYVGSNLLLNKKLKNFNLIIIDVKKLTINFRQPLNMQQMESRLVRTPFRSTDAIHGCYQVASIPNAKNGSSK